MPERSLAETLTPDVLNCTQQTKGGQFDVITERPRLRTLCSGEIRNVRRELSDLGFQLVVHLVVGPVSAENEPRGNDCVTLTDEDSEFGALGFTLGFRESLELFFDVALKLGDSVGEGGPKQAESVVRKPHRRRTAPYLESSTSSCIQ